MSKNRFGYREDKADERGGQRTERMGKSGYPKVGPKTMPKFEGPGTSGDFSGPGTAGDDGKNFGGEHG